MAVLVTVRRGLPPTTRVANPFGSATAMTRRLGPAGVLLCVLAVSCGNRSVELSTPPRLQASTEPTTLGSINEHVGALAVDDQRLYWSGAYAGADYESGTTGIALHSCEKDRCTESLVTYDSSRVDTDWGFGLHEGAIYWIRHKILTNGDSWDIASCAVAGCDGAPHVLYTTQGGFSAPLTYGSDAIYFGDGTWRAINRLSYSGAGQPQLVATADGDLVSLAVNGDYLYSLESSEDDRAVTLRRIRSDGSTPFETVAAGLEILRTTAVGYSPYVEYVNLAFDAAYVYWTSNTLTGSLERCPLAGCVDTPEVIASPIRSPTAPRVDGGQEYFQYDDAALGNSLASCTLPRCQPSAPIAHGLDDWNVVAIDDRYIYTATTDQMQSPDARWDFPSAQIRRFAK